MQEKPRRATIHDVAKAAGVSAATVSKVLRGVESVKNTNVERVREAVKQLDYRMDPLAADLRNEKRRIIGAVVPDLESPFFGALVTGLEQNAEAAGYTMIVASSRECESREADLVARMHDWRVAGTVLVPVRSEYGLGTQQMAALDMRAVLVDRVSANSQFDTVTADNYKASAEVASHLISAGHEHILLHGATHVSKSARTRLLGFTEMIKTEAPQTKVSTLLVDNDIAAQRLAIHEFFESRPVSQWPSAVFSLTQNSTLLVLSELRRRNVRIPQDIALIGFDDAEWMKTTWPSIAAVAQPVGALAARAITTLLARVEGTNTGFPVQHLEPCTLHLRQSAGVDILDPHADQSAQTTSPPPASFRGG